MAMLGTISTPIGILAVKSANGKLTEVDILPAASKQSTRMDKQSLAKDVSNQFSRYFSDGHFQFHLPLDVQGTDFQKKVWKIMRSIAPGKVMTYGEVAEKLGSSPRAVGNACRANPLPVIIPCHRIISQSGLGGYGGHTEGKHLAIKHWLLKHEGVVID